MPKKPVDIDKMLAESDAGRGPKNLKEQSNMMKGVPKAAPLFTMPMTPKPQIPHKDYAPKNISPHGDIGILDDKEQKAFFPNPIKGANAEWRSSKHLPMGRVRVESDGGKMTPHGSIYPAHSLKDFSGIKAGSKVGGAGRNARGVPAKDKGMTNDAGYRNPKYYGSY